MDLDLLAVLSDLCDQSTNTNKVFTPQKLSELNYAGFVIGGSLALRLYGYDIRRAIDEVDLIISEKEFDFSRVVKYFEGLNDCPSTSHKGDSKYCFEGLNGELYDVLTWNGKVDYTTKIFDGIEIKLQDEEDIWFKKKEYAFKGYTKHQFDLDVNNKIITVDEIKYFNEHFPIKQNIYDLPF